MLRKVANMTVRLREEAKMQFSKVFTPSPAALVFRSQGWTSGMGYGVG